MAGSSHQYHKSPLGPPHRHPGGAPLGSDPREQKDQADGGWVVPGVTQRMKKAKPRVKQRVKVERPDDSEWKPAKAPGGLV